MTGSTICVCGAGTMGSGIATLMALHGMKVILYDADPAMLDKASMSIQTNLEAMVQKGRIALAAKSAAEEAIHYTANINECIAGIIIEAIIENRETKTRLLHQLAGINPKETILATNTSSLSVTGIATAIPVPQRVVGMHFFNPPTSMTLVEIVQTPFTHPTTIEAVVALAKLCGKTTVLCKDSPGFIVNRVARHYYLESLKMVEEGIAGYETIDRLLESAGFKMGPFRLMDLIGNDINLAVTESLYEAFGHPARFMPSRLQKEKVAAGELGKKTGKGYYRY